MQETINKVRKRHPELTQKKVELIAQMVNYHDGNSEILSREMFEKEVDNRMIMDKTFDCWTKVHTHFFIYPNCNKQRWV